MIELPAHPCLLQHYSQQPSFGNSPDALRKCAGIIFIHTEE
jgi:hypothetical protein